MGTQKKLNINAQQQLHSRRVSILQWGSGRYLVYVRSSSSSSSMKTGSKSENGFKRQGQAWFCTTDLPSDIIVEVDDMFFHLHKFPLLSRSRVLERMIRETLNTSNKHTSVIKLDNIPGGATTFESIAKFCYGVKLELTATNVVRLRCASEHLSMTEDCVEENLIKQSDIFLDQVVLNTWDGSIQALHSCLEFTPDAENLNIVDKCIESLALKAAVADPNAGILSWPAERQAMQSPGGSILWNGISTGARLMNHRLNWWYDDASSLSLHLYTRLISRMAAKGIGGEVIAGSLVCYAKTYLPGLNLNRRFRNPSSNSNVLLSEEEQRALVGEIVRLLPPKKGLVPTKILFGLLRTAMILGSSEACKLDLEKRIGLQLENASLEDLLLPNLVEYTMEPLYNIDSIGRILHGFLEVHGGDGSNNYYYKDGGHSMEFGEFSHDLGDSSPILAVAKLIDGYLAEVGSDANLKPTKFVSLAAAIPGHARQLDDGIYRAIDVYLKAHSWLSELERESLCRLMDCQKLSLEACTHAAQNERLPLRLVVQVLFFEQLQLRTTIAECYLVSTDNLDGGSRSRPLGSHIASGGGGEGSVTSDLRENHVLKLGIDKMRTRVFQLEKVCTIMKQEIAKLNQRNQTMEMFVKCAKTDDIQTKTRQTKEKSGKERRSKREEGKTRTEATEKTGKADNRTWSGRFGFSIKPQMCSTQQNSVHESKNVGKKNFHK